MAAARQAESPERRCIITGTVGPTEAMIRLVMGPEAILVPDVAAKLPGRGLWVAADGPLIRAAEADGRIARGASRSLKTAVQRSAVPAGLADQIEGLLARRAADRLGLLNRAGAVLTGFDTVSDALKRTKGPGPAVLLSASDAGSDGRDKLKRLLGARAPMSQVLDRDALSSALGKENCVHVLVLEAGGTEQLTADLSRLEGVRSNPVGDPGEASSVKDEKRV